MSAAYVIDELIGLAGTIFTAIAQVYLALADNASPRHAVQVDTLKLTI